MALTALVCQVEMVLQWEGILSMLFIHTVNDSNPLEEQEQIVLERSARLNLDPGRGE